jgi:hypothetical protein
MTKVIKIGDIELRFGSDKDFAAYLQVLSSRQLDASLRASTQREARFHDGQAWAYAHAAELLSALVLDDPGEPVVLRPVEPTEEEVARAHQLKQESWRYDGFEN